MLPRPPRHLAPQVVAGALALALAPLSLAAPAQASRAPVSAVRTTTAQAAAGRRHDITVASFNVSGVLADGTRPAHQPWRARGTKVAQQLVGRASGHRGHRADVVALQETNTSRRLPGGRTQYTDLVHRMNGAVKGSPYRAVNPRLKLNATRIAYNARSVRLTSAGAFRWGAQEMRADGARMMAWAKFRVRATGKRFFFASVHLETAGSAIRARQWRQLVKVVPKLAHGLPVVVAGDFNATRNQKHNTAHAMLSRMRRAGFGDTLGQNGPGYLTYRHCRAKKVVDANFNSVNHFRRALAHYGHRDWVGQDVDYVFASNRLKVRSWELVADHRRGSSKLRGVIPSDHNLVRTTIALG